MFGVDLPFEVILIAFIILMLQPTLRSFCEGIIEWLVKATKIEILGFKINVIGPLTDLVQAISHYLGKLYAQVQQYPVALMTAFIRYFDFITKATFAISWEFERFAKYVVGVAIPDAITTARAGLAGPVNGITKIVRVLPGRTITVLPKALRGDLGAIRWLHDHIKAIQRLITDAGKAATALPVAKVGGVLQPIEARIAALTKRLSRAEKFGIAGALTATVAIGLQRLGLNHIRCENNKKIGRKICGLPGHLLDDLGSLLLDVFAFSAICQLLPLLEEGFNLIEPAIAEVTSGAAAVICRGGFAPPPALAVPSLRLPSGAQVGLALHLP